MYARCVGVPGGSKFHLALGTIHPCWNFTGIWCSFLDVLRISFFWIHDRGGDDVLCCNLPSSGCHLPSSTWIGLVLLCIWASGGDGPLSSAFLGRCCYLLLLQRRNCLSGGGILAVATSFLVMFSALRPSLAPWWTLRRVWLQKQRTWQIWLFLQVLVQAHSIRA